MNGIALYTVFMMRPLLNDIGGNVLSRFRSTYSIYMHSDCETENLTFSHPFGMGQQKGLPPIKFDEKGLMREPIKLFVNR
jgi:hypothetical protein